MYAIVYLPEETYQFNGATFYRVEGLFCGEIAPANSYELTEQEYRDWQVLVSKFHYINAENKAVNRAVMARDEESAFQKSRRKDIIIERMTYLWSKIQALTDLDVIDNSINSEYQNLINEYKSF